MSTMNTTNELKNATRTREYPESLNACKRVRKSSETKRHDQQFNYLKMMTVAFGKHHDVEWSSEELDDFFIVNDDPKFILLHWNAYGTWSPKGQEPMDVATNVVWDLNETTGRFTMILSLTTTPDLDHHKEFAEFSTDINFTWGNCPSA